MNSNNHATEGPATNESALAGLPHPDDQAAIREFAERWLRSFSEAVSESNAIAASAMFLPDGGWRDLLSWTWHLRNVAGTDALRLEFERAFSSAKPSQFALRQAPAPRVVGRADTYSVEAVFDFETNAGSGSGVIRLVVDESGAPRAWTMSTALDQLRGFEERLGERRPSGTELQRDFGGPNWLDRREQAGRYEEHDPTVLIVGGGQAGLAVAARLGHLDVDALVIDRMKRVGDNWRNRYRSLVLHNQVWVNHLPYMPFPEGWPVWIPKDKLANWFESYVDSMEINFWTETEFLGGSWDGDKQRWDVRIRRNGETRVMHPRHVVMSTGVSGIPHIPDIPGLDAFTGQVIHSGEYQNGGAYANKDVMVIGTGNSGHDVAQDLHGYGANVSIVQRSSTTVVSVDPAAQKAYGIYAEGHPTPVADLLFSSMPYPVLVKSHQAVTRETDEMDREFVHALNAVGFRTDSGADATGFHMKFMRRGGGYYLNVGCSDLIISGAVSLVQYSNIERFEADGARLSDGTLLPLDLIVLATGYLNQQELVRSSFGDDVAERVGPVWGFDDDGEMAAMWKRTGQPGLWFTGGSLAQSRIYSKYLALQVKAIEVGLIDISDSEGQQVLDRANAGTPQ